MKIGFVLDDSLDKVDGVQQYMLTVGRYLIEKGHDVHYLVGETHRSDISNIHSLSRNLQVRFNHNRMSIPFPANKAKIRKLLNQEQFDVLHVQMPYSPMLAARIIKFAPAKTAVIGTFHIVPYSGFQNFAARVLGWYLYRNSRRFDYVVGASRPAARFAKSVFHIKAGMIPNTVDTAAFGSGKMLKKYNDSKINIVFLGRLVERKGCQYLLNATKLLHDKHLLMNVRVIICGKGPLDSALKQYVSNNHLASVVHFEGFVSEAEKPNFLASAHIAVFPSTGGECFGIVLIEAMAAGSQVVLGGNNIGYSSVLAERPEQLFPPENTEKFAATLKHFIINAAARKRASRWQEADVKQYDVNEVGRQLIQAYKTSIAKRSV